MTIKVGLNKDGSNRTELRSWGDVQVAYRRDSTVEASRPKRGRPSKPQKPDTESEVVTQVHQNSQPLNVNNDGTSDVNKEIEISQPFHGFPTQLATIDFSVPPPSYTRRENSNHDRHNAEVTPRTERYWIPSQDELAELNRRISYRA